MSIMASIMYKGGYKIGWPLYNALQFAVFLGVFEERLPPALYWFSLRIKDTIELNFIPRFYL